MPQQMTDTAAALAAYERVATALAAAVVHQRRIANAVDGWPTGGSGSGRSSDTTSTTERTALAHIDEGHEAGRAHIAIAEIICWQMEWNTNMADAAAMIANLTGNPRPPDGWYARLVDVGPPLEHIAQANYRLHSSEGRAIV